MAIPSLGYEDDTTLSRIQVAETQLVEAINLFIAEKFLCAITLSGAAEEILGKLVEQKQGMAVINESVKKVREVEKKTSLNLSGGRSDTEIIREWNQTRNSLKHLVSPDEDSISINLCDGAYWMIRRALANAERLCLSVENKVEFENWVIMKVNL